MPRVSSAVKMETDPVFVLAKCFPFLNEKSPSNPKVAEAKRMFVTVAFSLPVSVVFNQLDSSPITGVVSSVGTIDFGCS